MFIKDKKLFIQRMEELKHEYRERGMQNLEVYFDKLYNEQREETNYIEKDITKIDKVYFGKKVEDMAKIIMHQEQDNKKIRKENSYLWQSIQDTKGFSREIIIKRVANIINEVNGGNSYQTGNITNLYRLIDALEKTNRQDDYSYLPKMYLEKTTKFITTLQYLLLDADKIVYLMTKKDFTLTERILPVTSATAEDMSVLDSLKLVKEEYLYKATTTRIDRSNCEEFDMFYKVLYRRGLNNVIFKTEENRHEIRAFGLEKKFNGTNSTVEYEIEQAVKKYMSMEVFLRDYMEKKGK